MSPKWGYDGKMGRTKISFLKNSTQKKRDLGAAWLVPVRSDAYIVGYSGFLVGKTVDLKKIRGSRSHSF